MRASTADIRPSTCSSHTSSSASSFFKEEAAEVHVDGDMDDACEKKRGSNADPHKCGFSPRARSKSTNCCCAMTSSGLRSFL